jgi:NADH-quinone oxidoreductase subunit L
MSNPGLYLWLIPGLPLAASILTAFLGPRLLRGQSHWPCLLGAVGSCILSVWVLLAVNAGMHDLQTSWTWLRIEPAPVPANVGGTPATVEGAVHLDIGLTLQADGLTAIMLVTVTFISSLIASYSVGYMHGDEGYARYFAEIALFIFAMTGLVLADNFIVLYAFWEGVGLCSYLLIGFWFTKPSAAAAARKAFLVTRLGDVGLMLGIILLWVAFHGANANEPLYALDFKTVFAHAPAQEPGLRLAVCLLLFCGAVGKSAQFPLHVWLPDAMEGPSPVSALIHAATMVTAGVYLVARCTPLYMWTPDAQLVVACIGGFTALLAALIALTQNDLKRVLAYSTISQLGYMFLALGSGLRTGGEQPLVALAAFAAIFHLFTHAFFKALLFLAAGSVMHAMGNVIDMRRFSGLRHLMPVTHWTFLCGAASLAGVPLLSGFWSKDEILATTFDASQPGSRYETVYLALFLSGLLTAGLTAFYTFRAYFKTFWGEERIPHEAGEHAHESPRVMLVPLVILAAGAVGVGIVVEPFTHSFSGFLQRHWLKNQTSNFPQVEVPQMPHELHLLLMLVSGLIALAGIGIAYWMYVRQPGLADQVARAIQGLYQLSLNKFHLDELYAALVVQPLTGLASFCRVFDLHIVDGLVDLVGQVPRFLGQLFRPIQNGLVQFYALAMVLGIAVFLSALAWRLAQ